MSDDESMYEWYHEASPEEQDMTNEDYATNDTAHGGACLTPADLEEMEARDRLIEAIQFELELANSGQKEKEQEQIRAAARSVRAGDDMLLAALRKNGVL